MPRTDLSAEKLALIATRLRQPDGPARYWIAEPIAILGVACRFPGGADSPEAFWKLLIEGRDAVIEVPPSRWNLELLYDPDPETPGRMATRWGGFLDEVDRFDAAFFGISPREAAAMDPQHRILLEVVWDALERAGQPAHRLRGSDTGVFIGVHTDDYAELQHADPTRLDVYSSTGTARNILAGRVAYLFDFQGPAVALDTACSSSLVAVHAACQSLRTGECRVAIAGGVNLILTPLETICLSRMRMLAPDGRCKTFDSRADGFVRSEGCGVVVLKRLADAIRDRDPVAAVIRGSAVNHDGRSAALTAPNGRAQEKVLRQALENAAVSPAAVEFVETHGSGTSLGDPIEVEALRAVYGATGTRPCVLGAAKTNIGHTEATAGIAGLIKVVLALEANAIPGNLHLNEVNANLPLANTRLELARGRREWRRQTGPRCAAVSSFGWSGTNAHVVLEEAPPRDDPPVEARSCHLLPVSGRTRNAAAAMARRFADLTDVDVAAVCATAGARRTHHRYRKAVVADTWEAARAALVGAEIAEGGAGGGVVFVYPGQGGQWAGMGRELYAEEEVFRRAIQTCAVLIRGEAGWDLEAMIQQGAEWSGIDRVQPALFAVSVALTAQWRDWGVAPDLVVGHSMGEIAAAHVAGALPLEDAVRVICRRSRLLKSIGGRGGMGLVELGAAAAAAAVAPYGGRVSIAATNSRRSTVLSGEAHVLDELGRQWDGDGVFWRRVQVDVASHSEQVDALGPELERALAGLRPKSSEIRMQSTVTGARIDGEELDARYWVRNVRDRVRFVEVLEGLLAEGFRRFVEVGPHGVLLGSIEEALGAEPGVVVGSLHRGEPDRAALLRSLGALYEWGAEIAWSRVNGAAERPVTLPGYAWQRERYWIDGNGTRPTHRGGAIAVAGERDLHIWDLEIEPGHRVAGREVMAGAAYIEAALRGEAEVHAERDREVRDAQWDGLLEAGRVAQLVIDEDRFLVHSRGDGDSEWQRHGGGRLVPGGVTARIVDLDAIRRRCPSHIPAADFYDRLARQGLEYGGTYRQVHEGWLGDHEVLARLGTAKLDACLQPASWSGPWSADEVRVPVRADRVALARDFTGAARAWAWAQWRSGAGYVVVTGEDGHVIAEIDGLHLERLGRADEAWLWSLEWERADRECGRTLDGRWLIVGAAAGESLADQLRARGAVCVVAADAEAVAGAEAWRGVVWVAAEEREESIHAAVRLVQTMVRRGWREPPRLWFVTSGTQAAGSGVTSLGGAGLWGFGRSLMYEHPEYRCTLVDTTTDVAELAAEIAAAADEDQVALRPEGRYVARLRPARGRVPEAVLRAARERPFRLEADAPGVLDGLTWRATTRRPPGDGEVEVEVEAAGLSFLDVLWSLGEYPGQQRGRSDLGREFAGRIVRVGAGVHDVREGDRVVGCAEGSLATHVVAPAAAVVPKPAGFGSTEAAGQAVAYATAYYALVELARLRPGERVLIHSAATGTGLAALEIAQQIGADVFATAGTEERRRALRGRGVGRVMDSRGVSFGRETLDATGGQGVDVVLNSLAGNGMRASFEAIGAYGRFLELGKRDVWGREWIRTGPFRKNLAYFVVDMAAMVTGRSDVFGRLLREVMQRLEAGTWRPLPIEIVEPDRVTDAFHRFAAGRQLGKMVVPMSGRRDARIARRGVASDGAYLITGGLGGLGLQIAEWLVNQGAGRVALMGRSAPTAEAEVALRRMRATGAIVEACAGDVADQAVVARVIANLVKPVRGVIHSAAVLDDRTVERLSPESISRVWRAKADGAWNLHTATAGLDLDCFVIMSSAAALIGSPGQAHYAAANSWADALIGLRRAQGLAGSTIQWGPWSEVGLAAARDDRGTRLADRGMHNLHPERGLAILGQVLEQEPLQRAVLRLNLRQWRQYYPKAAASPMLQALEQHQADDAGAHSQFRDTLERAPAEQRRRLLEEHIRDQIARVLRLESAAVPTRAPFSSLGFDSLIAIEFRNRLETTLGVNLSATVVWARPTVAQLAEHLATRIKVSLAPSDPPGDASISERTARIAAISEDAAEAELLEKLRPA